MVSPTLENCLRKLGTINIKWKYVLFCCTYSTVQISIHTVQCTVYNYLITLPNWSIPYIQSTYTASLTQWPWLCLSEVLTVYILTLPPWTNGHDSVLLKYLQSTYLHCPLDPIAITLPYWSTYSLHTYTIYTASLTQWPWLCLIGQLDGAYCTYILIYMYTVLWSQALFWVGSGVFKVMGPTSASVSQLQSIIVLNLNFYLSYFS